jgi:hypothetical protein
MPITIREILASDTISGAADKINFNFDQLLLNGGGPPGPPGPPGPIGPIGGRGIRGSVWYEGLGDPNLVPPTLTPEDEDNYLRGDGDVWTYNGSTWVNTGISLIGPVGPAGASGKFAEYQGQPGTYSTAGDTTLYPNLMTPPPSGTSGNAINKFIKAVVIGGLPGNLPGVINPNPVPGPEVIDSSLAVQIVQPDISLFVHQFNSSGGGIKFHGGDAIVDNFTNILGELAEIRLLRDDKLSINVPKAATAPSSVTDVDGLSVTTPLRGQLYQSGKRIQFQTGVSTSGYSSGDTNDFIVDAARYGSGSNPTIQLNVLSNTSAPTAAFRLGNTGTSPLPPQTGDARLDAGLITLSGAQQTNIYAGTTLPAGATGQVTIGASSQIVMRTINSASTGAISISTGNSTTGSISLSTGTTSTGNIGISTSPGAGRVDITSGATNTGGFGAINMFTDAASLGDIQLRTGNISSGNITISTSSGFGLVNIRSRAANSGSLGAINIATDPTSAGDILVSTSLGTGRVNINSGAINSGGLGAINLVTDSSSTGNIEISTSAGTGDINLTSGDDVNVVATDAILIATDTGSAGNITLTTAAGTGDIIVVANDAIAIATDTGSAGNITLTTAAGTGDINLTSGDDVNIVATDAIAIATDTGSAGNITLTTLGTGDINLTSGDDVSVLAYNAITLSNIGGVGGDIELLAFDALKLRAADDVVINHGSGDQVTIQPISGNSDAIIEIKPAGTNTRSDINLFGDALGTKNLQLRSDGVADEGQIGVSNGMSLRLFGGNTLGDQAIITAYRSGSDLTSAQDPSFRVNANIHYSGAGGGGTKAFARDEYLFASGRYTQSGVGFSMEVLWQKVGNVVNMNGTIVRPLASATARTGFLLPVLADGPYNGYRLKGSAQSNDISALTIDDRITNIQLTSSGGSPQFEFSGSPVSGPFGDTWSFTGSYLLIP